ncbi:MAG TPA: YceI family protein [Parafilimonas sp.]|nr:YceI family protein [Parafilimonas sp.]
MKKIISVCCLTFFIAATAYSQTYITRNGNISIYSHTPLEDVKAQNNEVASVLNAATGDLEFKLAVKSFHFEKTAMEDHFNDDDYMASGKYPKAGFKGKVTNISSADLSKDGKYNVTASGDLTIRDVTKPVTATGTITVNNGKATLASTFTIKRKEYNVIGESFVQKKISEDIQITVNCQYDKQ